MDFSQFTRQFRLAKTLRFELRPVGRTRETFDSKFRNGDERRAQAYSEVKDLLDREHKALLERALSNPPGNLDWEELAKAHETYRTGDKSKTAKDDLAAKPAEFRKKLVALFEGDSAYKDLTAATPKDVFAAMKKRFEDAGEEIPEVSVHIHQLRRILQGLSGEPPQYLLGRTSGDRRREPRRERELSKVSRKHPDFPPRLGTVSEHRHRCGEEACAATCGADACSPLLSGRLRPVPAAKRHRLLQIGPGEDK